MQEFWFEIVRFTLLQAFLSAGGALVVGLLLARLLYYYPGLYLKKILLSLGELVFVMPVMAASLAFLLICEGSYGLYSIVVVHVFLNALYAMGQILKGYECFLSLTRHQQSQLLRLKPWEVFIYLEMPGVVPVLCQTFLIIFCLCLSSFSSILLLGGGPSSTTLSVALYHALSVSLDFKEAGFFLILQVALSLLFAFFLSDHNKKSKVNLPFKRKFHHHWGGEILLTSLLFLYCLPILRLLMTALAISFDFTALLKTVIITLGLGIGTGILTTLLAVFVLNFQLTCGKGFKPSVSMIITATLSLPKIALVGGIFLLLYDFLDIGLAVYVVIIFVGTLCYLPFVLKSLRQSFRGLHETYYQQIQLLSLSFKDIFGLIVWPLMQDLIIKNMTLVTCFAMGNLSIPLLFGQIEVKTLPVLSYQALLRYDTELSGFYIVCLVALMAVIMLINSKRIQYVSSA